MVFEAKEKFNLTDAFIDQYKRKRPNWGPLGYVTYKRTYARVVAGTKRTEEWWETVKRVVEGTYTVQLNHCRQLRLPWNAHKAQHSAQTMYELMFSFKFLPPGRGLWLMGTDYIHQRGSGGLNNCAFCSTENIKYDFTEPFVFLMDMSMLGVGVAFDTKGAGTVSIVEPKQDDDEIFVVEDSKEGWVSVAERILQAYVGKAKLPFAWDYNNIRPAGEPIKTFGGIAPGPKPLIDCAEHLHGLLEPYRGKEVDSTLIVDIMNVLGKCVVSGGVRRTAELALGEADDADYLELKDPKKNEEALMSHRWASNNSVFAYVGMDYSKIGEQTALNGEPGYVWLDHCQHYGRFKDGHGEHDIMVAGTNPCVPYKTRILTRQGYQEIGSLANDNNFVEVWNGKRWSLVNPRLTARKARLVQVNLSDGTSLKCTPYHTWVLAGNKRVKAHELQVGDKLEKFDMPVLDATAMLPSAYTQGFFSGDGQESNGHKGALLYGEKQKLATVLDGTVTTSEPDKYDRIWIGFPKELKAKNFVPHEYGRDTKLSWLAGLIDSDGTEVENPNSTGIQITSIDKDFLLEVRLMLTTLGVQAKVTKNRDEGMRLMPDGKGGLKEYPCKDTYRLLINASDTSHLALSGMTTYRVQIAKTLPNRDARRFVTVESVNGLLYAEDVYCFTEPHNNTGCFEGIITGQCAEQSLESFEMCNLVETFPSLHEDEDEYMKTLKYAYLYAKTVTLIPTHNEKTNQIMLRNRRIGLSQSGIVESFQRHGRRMHFEWCDEGYEYIQHLDQLYSRWLCVPESIKTTTVKPSGTVSLLPGVTPGIHYPHSEYYYRTIRIQNGSPLIQPLIDAGHRVEESEYGDNTQVVYFPVHEPFFDRAKTEVSIWEQLENAAQMQHYWSDNQVSVTITFKPEEAKDIPRALELYETKLKAVSFLPLLDHNYKQAPYQTIDKAEYDKATEKLKKAKLRGLNTDEVSDEYCTTDACEIKNATTKES